MSIYLVEVSPRSGGGTVRLGFSSGAVIPVYDGVLWKARLLTVLDWRGTVSGWPSAGTVRIAIGDGQLSALTGYDWDDAPVTIRRGEAGQAFSSFVTLRKGRVEDAAWDRDTLTLRLRDIGWRLDVDAQQTLYAGTGGDEGEAGLAGVPKPLGFGYVRQAQPVWFDQTAWKGQVHERAIQSVIGVWDRMVPLTAAGDISTLGLASLGAWTPVAGRYITDLSRGMIRLGAPPDGPVTVDFEGDAAGGYVSSAMDVLARLLTWKGGLTSADIDQAALDAVDSARPWRVGLYLPDGGARLYDLAQRLAASAGAWLSADALDRITVGLLGFGTSVATLAGWRIEGQEIVGLPAPVWRQRVAYARSQQVVPRQDAGPKLARDTETVAGRPAQQVLADIDAAAGGDMTTAEILAALAGAITRSELHQTLSSEIDLVYDAQRIEGMLLTGESGATHIGDTAPSSPSTKPNWIDTSGAEPVLKRWNGSAWVVDTTANIDAVRDRVATAEGNISLHGDAISDLDTRVTSTENEVTVVSSDVTALSARIGNLPIELENGGFENGSNGWVLGSRWSIQTNAANAHSGSKYARLLNGGADNNSIIRTTVDIPVAAGDRIETSFWLWRASGSTGELLVGADFHNGAGTWVRSANTLTDIAPAVGVWTRIRAVHAVVSGNVADGATNMRIAISGWNVTAGEWRVDDVRIARAPRADMIPEISANATAINSLDARVTTAEGEISAHASQITALSAEIDDVNNINDAQATAISSLQTDVSNLEGDVSAQASSLTVISARVGTIETLIENGSFENGGEGWYLGNWTIETDPTLAHSGSNHVRIAQGGANSGSVLLSTRRTHVSVGDRIMMSGWLRRGDTATDGLIFGVNLFDAGGAFVRTKNLAADLRPSASGTWQFFRTVATIASGDLADGAVQISPFVSAWGSTEGAWRADDVRAEILPREGDFPTIAANSAAIAQEQIVRADADSALASDIETVTTTVNGHTTTIQQHTTSINGLKGQWVVKIDNGERVIGIGLASSAPGQADSLFEVVADRFAVAAPGATGAVPFIVDTASSSVIIDNAYIRNLSADKILVDWSSLVANGNFEQVTAGWSTLQNGAIIGAGGGGGHSGPNFLYREGGTGGTLFLTGNSVSFTARPDDRFTLTAACKYTGGAVNGDCRVYITWFDSTGAQIGYSTLTWVKADLDAIGGGGIWLVKTLYASPPSGAVRGRVSISVSNHTATGTWWNVDSVDCWRGVRGTMIEQNAITTGHINVIGAEKISETTSRKWAAETGADRTGDHTAAAISGQGAFATMSQLTSGTHIGPGIVATGHLVAGAVTLGPSASQTFTFTLDGNWNTGLALSVSVESTNNFLVPFVEVDFDVSAAAGQTVNAEMRIVDEASGQVWWPARTFMGSFTFSAATNSTTKAPGATGIMVPTATGTRTLRFQQRNTGTATITVTARKFMVQVHKR